MVATNYSASITKCLVHEGGWSDHPKDPGGATMKGVTQRVYDAYRARKNRMKQTVRKIADVELHEIYRTQYADAVRFDELPIGLDYVQLDGGINSGPGQSNKWLQRALKDLGLYLGGIDGILGNGTLRAIEKVTDVDALIARICDIRLAFLRSLKTWPTFGKGWKSRVEQVGDGGQDWATGGVPRDANFTYVAGMEAKALVSDAALPSAPVSAPTIGAAGGGIGILLESTRQAIEPLAGSSNLVNNVLVGLTIGTALVAVGGMLYGIYAGYRRKKLAQTLDLDVQPAV